MALRVATREGRSAVNHTRVELSVTKGSLKGRGFVFERPACVVVGRGEDCALRLPADREHAAVSRHHCLLEIAPPEIRVTDLGSLNGTFVNGERIGQRTASRPWPEPDGLPCWSVSLRDGDEVRVGYTVLRVTVTGWNEEKRGALLAQEQES
jgi:pSer/pThr/pTyr-binding forkhead associated (FHA) protein